MRILTLIIVLLSVSATRCSKEAAKSELSTKIIKEPSPTHKPTSERAFNKKLVGVPPIDLADLAPARIVASKKLNGKALLAQNAQDYSGAIKLYRGALNIDPGNIMARYNLATAYQLSGKADAALVLLQELKKQPKCPVCRGRLVRAKADDDFATIYERLEFVKITSGVSIAKLTSQQAGEQILAAIGNEGSALSKLAPLIHPRNAVEITRNYYDTEEERKTTVYGLQSLITAFSEMGPFAYAEISKCDEMCCKLDVPPESAGDLLAEIIELCFARGSGGVLTLSSISVGWGS